MNTTEATQRLEHKGIRATANRILVYRELARHGRPMSLADMENSMPQMDKSSIFRVLSLFLDHDVVHTFTDGRGVQNYELCHDDGQCHHDDGLQWSDHETLPRQTRRTHQAGVCER